MQLMMHPQLRRVPRSIGQCYRCEIVVGEILLRHLDSDIYLVDGFVSWRPTVSGAFWHRRGKKGGEVPSNNSCHAASSSGRGGPENGLLWSSTRRRRCSYLMAWLDARAGSTMLSVKPEPRAFVDGEVFAAMPGLNTYKERAQTGEHSRATEEIELVYKASSRGPGGGCKPC